MDTTYFGRSFGVMVFRSQELKKNLYWKYLHHETLLDYIEGINYLMLQGWNIQAIVCDGKRGLFNAFRSIPVQMCQFHQTAIITRYITRNPKLDASKNLKCMLKSLTSDDQTTFEAKLNIWHTTWKDFLHEKTFYESDGKLKWHFTHKRLRSAYRSLTTNLPFLFTYKKYPELNIPNTTNSLEGIFSRLKSKLNNHPGLKWERKMKFIDKFLAS